MGGIGRGEGRRDMGERGTAAHGDPPPEADAEREGVRESEKIRDTSPAPGGYRTPGHTGPKTTKHQQNTNTPPLPPPPSDNTANNTTNNTERQQRQRRQHKQHKQQHQQLEVVQPLVMPPTRHHRWEFVKGVPFCVRSRHGGAARLLTGQGIEHSATRPAASMQYDINPHDTWKESPAGKRREKGASILIIIHRLEKRWPSVLDIFECVRMCGQKWQQAVQNGVG